VTAANSEKPRQMSGNLQPGSRTSAARPYAASAMYAVRRSVTKNEPSSENTPADSSTSGLARRMSDLIAGSPQSSEQ
jgi:hypothetical protein